MAILIMDNQQKKFDNSNEDVKAMFHDFLGMKTMKPNLLADNVFHSSPSAEGSSGGGGGCAPPLSVVSDLVSERQVGNHLYAPRSEVLVPEISNRLIGAKRSSSNSAFAESSRDGIPRTGHDPLEGLHLMKTLKNSAGGDRIRRSGEDGSFYGLQSIRPSATSLMLKPSTATRHEAGQSIQIGTAVEYPLRGSKLVPIAHQVSANRFGESNLVSSTISQPAADEGSRTGIKSTGILRSINAGSGTLEKRLSGSMPSSSKAKSVAHSEPESSAPGRSSLASASRQMTIFYGGQAHVFDDVHPNKADVIMALAGSSGGSWSTTYSPRPPVRPCSESYKPRTEHYDTNKAPNSASHRESRGKSSGNNNAAQGVAAGGRRDAVLTANETRSRTMSGEAVAEEKNDKL